MRRRGASNVVYAVAFAFILGGIWAGINSAKRLTKIWPVPAPAVPVAADDAATVERGEHLARSRGCAECHGLDFGGRVMLDNGFVAKIIAGNLTSGKGSAVAAYSDAQIARAIRDGVGADGRSLLVMPSSDYHNLDDADVGAIVAFLRKASPVERDLGTSQLSPGGRVMLSLLGAKMLSAEQVDHQTPHPPAPPVGATAAYGAYVAQVCAGCHRPNFAGGVNDLEPNGPPATNLTPGGPTRDWTAEQFSAALREGHTPDGKQINPQFMPWTAFMEFNDTETEAIRLYLHSLPAVPDHK